MRVSDFDYELPPDRIAQRPPIERDGARLLVVGAEGRSDESVRDLANHLPTGALVVVNDTRVVPSRLLGEKRGTRGRVELLLVKPAQAWGEMSPVDPGPLSFTALGRASKGLREGMEIQIGEQIVARVVREATARDGALEISLATTDGTPLAAALDAAGHVPLPPYIDRPDDASDRARYQTVYASAPGAIAAPTAGLHLSERVLGAFRAKEIDVATVTLHVGLGTFLPVVADDLDHHPMHAEAYTVSASTRDAIRRARDRAKPVVAIGTTVVRALESAADPERAGHVRAFEGETRLLIQPGFAFRVVDTLLTNFHLPRSTLLALVCAFAGRERVLGAYAHAIDSRYHFYSYGDAMLVSRESA